MKPIFLFFCALLIGGCATRNAEVALVNPGFEAAPDAQHPIPGWTLSQHAGAQAYEMTLDSQEAFQGRGSFRIKRIAPQRYGSISQSVAVTTLAGRTVELDAALKTRDVGQAGWVLMMNVVAASGNAQVRAAPLSGSHDFARVSIRTKLPADAKSIDVSALLLDDGTAWLDDVHLRVLDE
jgi:hypothetical protein